MSKITNNTIDIKSASQAAAGAPVTVGTNPPTGVSTEGAIHLVTDDGTPTGTVLEQYIYDTDSGVWIEMQRNAQDTLKFGTASPTANGEWDGEEFFVTSDGTSAGDVLEQWIWDKQSATWIQRPTPSTTPEVTGPAALKPVVYNGSGYVPAIADADTHVADLIELPDGSRHHDGKVIWANHGLTVGAWYYLSQTAAGGLVVGKPATGWVQQLFFVEDANIVHIDIEEAYNSTPPVIINGTDSDDNLSGTDGDDSINSFGGNDIINGTTGNDVVNMGAGDDVFIAGGGGNDTINGGDGNDTLDLSGLQDVVVTPTPGVPGSGTVTYKGADGKTYTITYSSIESIVMPAPPPPPNSISSNLTTSAAAYAAAAPGDSVPITQTEFNAIRAALTNEDVTMADDSAMSIPTNQSMGAIPGVSNSIYNTPGYSGSFGNGSYPVLVRIRHHPTGGGTSTGKLQLGVVAENERTFATGINLTNATTVSVPFTANGFSYFAIKDPQIPAPVGKNYMRAIVPSSLGAWNDGGDKGTYSTTAVTAADPQPNVHGWRHAIQVIGTPNKSW